jgi:transcriptional regulator of acetoin/glycerol metabolism
MDEWQAALATSPQTTNTPDRLAQHNHQQTAPGNTGHYVPVSGQPSHHSPNLNAPIRPSRTLAQVEAETIRSALDSCRHNRTAAAKVLDIHRSTLIRKMRQLGLDTPGSD